MRDFQNHMSNSMSATCDRLLINGVYEDDAAQLIAAEHGKTVSAALGKFRNHVSHLVKNGLANVERKAIDGRRWVKASNGSTSSAPVSRAVKPAASPARAETVKDRFSPSCKGTFRAMRGEDIAPASVTPTAGKATEKTQNTPEKRSTFFNATRAANTIADTVLAGSVRFADLVEQVVKASGISRDKARSIIKARLVSLGAKERAGFWYIAR